MPRGNHALAMDETHSVPRARRSRVATAISAAQRRSEHGDLRRAANGDAAARERVIRAYLPLARSVARHFERGGSVPREDLQQIAAVGLIKALDRFDPERGVQFSSYAVPTMRGEILRYIRDFTWTVRPPRDLQDRLRRVTEARNRLTTELGRQPDVAEVAERLGCTADEVTEALVAERARTRCSLDAAFPPGGVSPAGARVEDPGFAAAEGKLAFERLLGSVCESQRVALSLRFVDDLTQDDIAERMGCSQMHVSRTLRAALRSIARGERSSQGCPG